MRRTLHVGGTIGVLVLALTAACSSEDGASPAGAGGMDGMGGAGGAGGMVTGGGGAVASGGLPASGGVPSNTGGIAPAGGGPGTGGVSTGGVPETGGFPASGGAPESGGSTGSGGAASGGSVGSGGGGGKTSNGACCSDGNCLCHGPDPSELTAGKGTFDTQSYRISTGTVYYPTNAEPPFAGVAICGGFTNTGPEMNPWGTFYASHGIVTVVVTTGGSDQPATRGQKLLAAVTQLKGENTKAGSPLNGKLSDRFGTSGYSMGGGGTTLASADESSLKTSIGLAAYNGRGTGVSVPTLMLCGASDTTAPCRMSQSVYSAITGSTPKMMISINGATHFSWFGPTNAGGGTSGKYALAFQKVYLEGDERWKPLLVSKPTNGTQTTNIQ